MKTHHITIHTTMPDTSPSPSPQLIADLVDAVLRAPGLRVRSVEVAEIASCETVTKRAPKVEKSLEFNEASYKNIP